MWVGFVAENRIFWKSGAGAILGRRPQKSGVWEVFGAFLSVPDRFYARKLPPKIFDFRPKIAQISCGWTHGKIFPSRFQVNLDGEFTWNREGFPEPVGFWAENRIFGKWELGPILGRRTRKSGVWGLPRPFFGVLDRFYAPNLPPKIFDFWPIFRVVGPTEKFFLHDFK